MAKVVGLGEILWDVFPDGAVLGGAPGNFACHVSALGQVGIVASIIGKDDWGRRVKDEFRNLKAETLLQEVDYPTGTVMVELDGDGKASYNFTDNSAWDHLSFTEELKVLAEECDAVCFGSLAQRNRISRETIYKFLDSTKKSCIKVFDINIRQKFYSKEIIESSLERATVLKLNDEELPLLMKLLSLSTVTEEAIKTLTEKYDLNLIVLTMGSKGSLLYRVGGAQSFIVPPKIEVVDTVGAGDSFTAAVVHGLLNVDNLDTINRDANRLAAYVCSRKGGMP